MSLDVSPSLEEFNRRADLKRAELLFAQREEEEQRLQAESRRDELDGIELLTSVIAAVSRTTPTIAVLHQKLDRLDAANVQALLENEAELREVRALREQMLLAAYTLPDGRRVFRTEDGSRVFDEHGAELSPDVLAPQAISDDHPSWEDLQAIEEREQQVTQERIGLIEHRERLDDMRDRLDDPDLSAEDRAALDREMDDTPPRVAAITGSAAPPTPEAALDLSERPPQPAALTFGGG